MLEKSKPIKTYYFSITPPHCWGPCLWLRDDSSLFFTEELLLSDPPQLTGGTRKNWVLWLGLHSCHTDRWEKHAGNPCQPWDALANCAAQHQPAINIYRSETECLCFDFFKSPNSASKWVYFWPSI